MQFKGIVFGLCLSWISFNIFAAEQIIKEEVTPPPAEGAITVNQIPPLLGNKPTVAQQPGTVIEQTTVTTTVTPAPGGTQPGIGTAPATTAPPTAGSPPTPVQTAPME